MSGLFGPKAQSTAEPKLNAIQVNQSSYGAAIPLIYGQCRVPLTLLWYDAFTAIPHTERQRGGKGGGGGVSSTTYTYTAAMIMGLCEGPIAAIGTVWKDKDLSSLAALGLTSFLGNSPQSVWSYLSASFPAAAIPYDRTAFVAHAAFELGGSASLPNLTFEVTGLVPFDIGTVDDAEPAAILSDYLTNSAHGAGFGYLGDVTDSGATSWRRYCRAMGFFLSPEEKTQRPAHEFVAELLQITNAEAVWSNGELRIIPRGDEEVTGSLVTYTPDLTPEYELTDADFIADGGEDPVTVERKSSAELFNIVRVEFLNRDRQYNPEPAEARDELDIALNGERPAPVLRLHAIKDAQVARQVAQMLLQRGLYVRNTYTFTLPFDYSRLEPMDYVSLTEGRIGLTDKLVRILSIEDDQDDKLRVRAEEVPVGPAGAPRYNWETAQGYAANYAAAPGSVLTPYIFTAPPLLVSAEEGYEIWIAASGPNNGAWGGCDVYFSLDDLEYVFAGSINGSARHGTLGALINAGADPDTSTTMRCVLSNSTLELGTGTTEDADNNRLLLMVDGEVMSYRDAVLVSAGTYDVSYLRRGKFGSSRTGHASGAKWARLDAAVFRMRYDSGLAGRTVYFKFPSKNVYGGGQQTLDACTAYTLTISRDVSSGLFFKSTDTLAWDTDAYSADGYTDGCSLQFRALRTDGGAMMGLNSDPTANASYDTLDFAFYLKIGGTIGIWESGVDKGDFGTYTTLTQFDLRHDGYMVQYLVNGAVVRAVPIVGQRFFMDSSIYTPGAGFVGIQWGPLSANGVRDSNLLNVAAWVVGTSSFAWFANFFASYSSLSENAIVLAGNSGAPLDPYGVSSPLWECRPDAAGGASGGFINFGDLRGLDHSKAYRFCMWFRWNSAAHADAGSIYLGPGTNETNDLVSAGGGANANPYFIQNVPAAMGLTPNKWYLIVGVVHGSGYAGGNSGLSGVYDPATGQRVVLGPDFRNIPNVVLQIFRAYPYYYTDTAARIWMARPRVDLMDGREPSLSALLSPNGQLAYRNTVGTPQIDRGAATELLVATRSAQSLSFSTSTPVVVTVPALPEEADLILTATCASQLTALSAGTSSISARIIAGQAGGPGEWGFGFPTFSEDDIVHRRDFAAAGESWSSVSLERRFTLPANTVIDVALIAFVSGSGSLRNVILKVEVIKR
jgi:hypothetical protein